MVSLRRFSRSPSIVSAWVDVLPAAMPALLTRMQRHFSLDSISFTSCLTRKSAQSSKVRQCRILYAFFICDVSSNWDDLSGNVFAVRLHNTLELLFGSANDVDLGAVHSQSLSDLTRVLEHCFNVMYVTYHQTNPTAATGDQRHLVLDIEYFTKLEVWVVGHFCVCRY